MTLCKHIIDPFFNGPWFPHPPSRHLINQYIAVENFCYLAWRIKIAISIGNRYRVPKVV